MVRKVLLVKNYALTRPSEKGLEIKYKIQDLSPQTYHNLVPKLITENSKTSQSRSGTIFFFYHSAINATKDLKWKKKSQNPPSSSKSN